MWNFNVFLRFLDLGESRSEARGSLVYDRVTNDFSGDVDKLLTGHRRMELRSLAGLEPKI